MGYGRLVMKHEGMYIYYLYLCPMYVPRKTKTKINVVFYFVSLNSNKTEDNRTTTHNNNSQTVGDEVKHWN